MNDMPMKSPGIRIAVASGKGGTGKTTIATNLAHILARDSCAVTYADADVEEPNGHLFFPLDEKARTEVSVMNPVVDYKRCDLCGVCADVCEFNALAVVGNKVLVFPALCHSCGACAILCPQEAILETPRSIGLIRSGVSHQVSFLGGELGVSESQAPPVIRALKRRLPQEGTVVIDAPPGTSCPVVEAVTGADYVVLVTEPTPFGLNDLRLAVGMLRELHLPFGVVINRSDIGGSMVRDYCRTERIRILLEVPFDRRTARAYAVGRLASETDRAFAGRMRKLYESVLQEVMHVRVRRRQR